MSKIDFEVMCHHNFSSLLLQILNKNIAFRAICSSAFNGANGSNLNRLKISSTQPLGCGRCQQNPLATAMTVCHSNFPRQIDSFRSYSSNTSITPTVTSSSSIGEKLKKLIGIHRNSKSVNLIFPSAPRSFTTQIDIDFSIEYATIWQFTVRTSVRQHRLSEIF